MPTVLTTAVVDRIKPDKSKRLEVPDGGLPSFYLVVQPSGAKSWAVRYRSGGKPRKHTIGPYPAIDLRKARELARTALTQAATGTDPGEERIARRRAEKDDTLAERDLVRTVAATFVDRYAKVNTREASWRMTKRILDGDVAREWGERRIQDITRRDVVELLDKVVDRGAPILANRTLAAVRRMFGWLRERGVVDANPAEGLKAPAPEQSRDRILSDDELRLVWRASESLGHPFGPMIRLLMLTGQRLREVSDMSDREIDPASKLWTIPRERAKNDVAHQVPLSDAAIVALASATRIKGSKEFVFSTNGRTPVSGYSKAKERLDAEMLRLARQEAEGDPEAVQIPQWTFHDLRRTMASGMARLGINLPVIEKVLNHVSGSFGGIVSVYQRHSFADEKRVALETWGDSSQASSAKRPRRTSSSSRSGRDGGPCRKSAVSNDDLKWFQEQLRLNPSDPHLRRIIRSLRRFQDARGASPTPPQRTLDDARRVLLNQDLLAGRFELKAAPQLPIDFGVRDLIGDGTIVESIEVDSFREARQAVIDGCSWGDYYSRFKLGNQPSARTRAKLLKIDASPLIHIINDFCSEHSAHIARMDRSKTAEAKIGGAELVDNLQASVLGLKRLLEPVR